MKGILSELLRMSAEGSLVILAVWLAGALLRRCKAPARPAALLWLVACFRLLCPFQPRLSLPTPRGTAAAVGTALSELEWGDLTAAAPQAAGGPDLLPGILAAVYGAGVLALAARAFLKYHSLKSHLALAYRTEDGYYTGTGVDTPLILGVFRPRIYLPSTLEGRDKEMVLAHERAHLRWKDPWTRLLFYGTVCLHWYNPLVWAAYFRFVRDTEAACDEEVLREQRAERAAYSRCLLALSQDSRIPAGAVAFGRYPLKGRVKHILRWQKPGRFLTALALVVVLSVGAACTFSFAEGQTPVEQVASSLVTGQEEESEEGEMTPQAAPEQKEENWLWPVPEYTYVSNRMIETSEEDPENQRTVGSSHKGVDLAAPEGSEILAMADGVVEKAGYDVLGSGSGYGYLVLLRHENGWRTLYAHCSEVCVQEGDTVRQGDLIARVGHSGYSTGNHCHVEMLDENGNRYDLCQETGEP